MKWKAKISVRGELRVVRRFAWLPHQLMDSNKVIWLERYSQLQVWQDGPHYQWERSGSRFPSTNDYSGFIWDTVKEFEKGHEIIINNQPWHNHQESEH